MDTHEKLVFFLSVEQEIEEVGGQEELEREISRRTKSSKGV